MNPIARQHAILSSFIGHVLVIPGVYFLIEMHAVEVGLLTVILCIHGLLFAFSLLLGLFKFEQAIFISIDLMVWALLGNERVELDGVIGCCVLAVWVLSVALYAAIFFQKSDGLATTYENMATLMFPVVLLEVVVLILAILIGITVGISEVMD